MTKISIVMTQTTLITIIHKSNLREVHRISSETIVTMIVKKTEIAIKMKIKKSCIGNIYEG